MQIDIKLNVAAHNLGKRLILDGRPFIGGICLHDTAGSGTHNDTLYLANPGDGRKVSVDFTVERDGSIYQLNPDLLRYCTYHAGRATKWRVGNRVFNNYAVTQVLLGIELPQKNNLSLSPMWPDAQVHEVARLCVYLCEKFNLKKEQITTHAQIITDGSRTDPRKFPFTVFWNSFNAIAHNDATTDIHTATVYSVKPGDSLWKIANLFNTSVEDIKAFNNLAAASNVIFPGQNLIVKR